MSSNFAKGFFFFFKITNGTLVDKKNVTVE